VTDARRGEWLPKPAPEIKRPTDLPAAITLHEAQRLSDPLPASWTPLAAKDSIEAHGVFDSHFIYYKIPADAGATVDVEVLPGDAVVGSDGTDLLPAVVSKDNGHFAFTLPAGRQELIVLHEKMGHRNGPTNMEKGGSYGLLSIQGARAGEPICFSKGGALGVEREVGESLSRGKGKIGTGWESVPIGPNAAPAPSALLTWYRMQFALPAQEPGVWVPWHLHLEAEGDGFIYVNGRCLGRYWQVGPQHDFYIPETWLNFGAGKTNVIALNLRPRDKGVAVKAVQIAPDSSYAEFR
jgi:hypothetical protein